MFCQYYYEPIVCAVTSCLVPKPAIWQLKWRISVADLSLFIRGQNVNNFPNTGIFAWIMSCTYYKLNKGKKFNFYLQFSLGYFAPKIVKGLGWVSHEIPNCNIPPVPKVSLHSFHSCHYWGFWNERDMSSNSELGSFSETSSSSDERNILRRKCDNGNWDQENRPICQQRCR